MKTLFLAIAIAMMAITPSLVNAQPDPEAQLKALKQQELQLQRQIQLQQSQIKQTQLQLEQQRKETLYAVGLPKPKLTPTDYDIQKNCAKDQSMPTPNSTREINWYKIYLTHFACGHVKAVYSNNTALREFTLIANDNNGFGTNIAITKNATDPVKFPAWTFNGTVPGPTIRVTQGDHVKVTVINSNNSKFAHSWHTHSIHAGMMDGMNGPGGSIPPGEKFTYEFIARPTGVYPWHCHMEPVQTHIMRGLYGQMIIDPPIPRERMLEMNMLMNGFSFNNLNTVNPSDAAPALLKPPTAEQLRIATQDFKDVTAPWKDAPATAADKAAKKDNQIPAAAEEQQQRIKDEALSPGGGEESQDNQFYAVNTVAFAYTANDMINLKVGQPVRIYLSNLVEFDPVNSFHLHGNMFNYFPAGTSMQPDYLTDIVILGQGDRAILEFTAPLPGDFMFHAHINRFANLGWLGMFHVSNDKLPLINIKSESAVTNKLSAENRIAPQIDEPDVVDSNPTNGTGFNILGVLG